MPESQGRTITEQEIIKAVGGDGNKELREQLLELLTVPLFIELNLPETDVRVADYMKAIQEATSAGAAGSGVESAPVLDDEDGYR